MPPFQAIVLGVVQGLTEFLPVSSSAHLTLLPWYMGWEDPGLAFDVSLHLGTLLGVLVYFWNDLWVLLKGSERTRWFSILVVGTVPGAVAGILLKKQAETAFRSPPLIAGTLIGAGLLLAWADRRAGPHSLSDFTTRAALLVGLAQAFAVIPGVSRSGITICTALFLGFDRTSAARFSFLLSIPIIAGAGLVEAPKIIHSTLGFPSLAMGFLASAIAGFFSILFLIRLLRTRTYMPFAAYRMLLGGFILWKLGRFA
jgi:undecaprenyl-diphosphatase